MCQLSEELEVSSDRNRFVIFLKNGRCHRLNDQLRVCTLAAASFFQGADLTSITKELTSEYNNDLEPFFDKK